MTKHASGTFEVKLNPQVDDMSEIRAWAGCQSIRNSTTCLCKAAYPAHLGFAQKVDIDSPRRLSMIDTESQPAEQPIA